MKGVTPSRADTLAREGTTVSRHGVDRSHAGLVERTDLGDHVSRRGHAHFTCTDRGPVVCVPQVEVKVRPAKTPKAIATQRSEVQLRGVTLTLDARARG